MKEAKAALREARLQLRQAKNLKEQMACEKKVKEAKALVDKLIDF